MSQILAPDFILANADPASLLEGKALLVEGGRVRALGDLPALSAAHPHATVRRLPDALVLAGFVNGHQHGRGLSQIQLGFSDDFLETWIANRRGRGVLDSYAITRLAAARMAANGVTTAIHANFSYGSGDYEKEVRGSIEAYLDVGIRVTMSVGVFDRGAIAYPPHEACFCAGLSPDLQSWLGAAKPAYMPDIDSTIQLMHRLLHDYAGEPRVRLCYGPAGPQWVKDESWRRLAEDAAALGLGINLHALESPAQRDAMKELYPEGVFKALKELGALNPRTIIAHGVWMSAADCAAVAEAGATVVRNPGSNLRLRNGIAPLAMMLAAGVRVAVGTDNCGCDDSEDILAEMRMAGLLARTPDWNGLPPPSTGQLLAMLTENGAVASGFPGATGRLEPGAPADLVALKLSHVRGSYLDPDMPLLEAVVARGRGADIVMTMVGGEVIYEDGRLAAGTFADIESAAAATALAGRLPADPQNLPRTRRFRAELAEHYKKRAGDGVAIPASADEVRPSEGLT